MKNKMFQYVTAGVLLASSVCVAQNSSQSEGLSSEQACEIELNQKIYVEMASAIGIYNSNPTRKDLQQADGLMGTVLDTNSAIHAAVKAYCRRPGQ